MMKSWCFASVALIGALIPAAASAAVVQGFTLGDNGGSLVRFNVANPANTVSIDLSGEGTRLDSIDFRPATGELFGLDRQSGSTFRVNTTTGALTRVNTGAPVVATGTGGDIDWNPTIDRLRFVTTDDNNIVFNPLTGATTVVTNLAYGALDPNAGANPNIVGNAYTNSFAANFGGMTTQFVIDSELDILGILANNAGAITTVAGLTFGGARADISVNSAFDIFFDSDTGQNLAYVLAEIGGVTDLFLLDLATGALSTGAGAFADTFGTLSGLAIAEVPLPAAAPFLVTGLAGLVLARRRKQAAKPGAVAAA